MANVGKPGFFRKFWYAVQFCWTLVVWVVAPLLLVGRFVANYEETGNAIPAVKAVASEAIYPLKVGFDMAMERWSTPAEAPAAEKDADAEADAEASAAEKDADAEATTEGDAEAADAADADAVKNKTAKATVKIRPKPKFKL